MSPFLNADSVGIRDGYLLLRARETIEVMPINQIRMNKGRILNIKLTESQIQYIINYFQEGSI